MQMQAMPQLENMRLVEDKRYLELTRSFEQLTAHVSDSLNGLSKSLQTDFKFVHEILQKEVNESHSALQQNLAELRGTLKKNFADRGSEAIMLQKELRKLNQKTTDTNEQLAGMSGQAPSEIDISKDGGQGG